MGSCMRCGRCCTSFGVCVTPSDISRIAATGMRPADFVSVIPEQVPRERTEPAILIDGERSLLVLGWKAGGRICRFYNGSGCEIYESRPALCRTYPFALSGGELSDMKSRACPVRWRPDDEAAYLEDMRNYEKDLADYRRIAERWNAKGGGSLRDFLAFALKKQR